MNWNLSILVLLFMTVFLLVTISLLFYIRHWASRHVDNKDYFENEGVYFKRYIPEQLRHTYDDKRISLQNTQSTNIRAIWARVTTGIVLLFAAAIPMYSVTSNVDLFLTPIELNSKEINNLDYTEHKWQRMVDNNLPNLSSVLASTEINRFIVPYNNIDKKWLLNGINIRQVAFNHWNNFASRNNLIIEECRWENIRQCQRKHSDAVILVLPGFWNFEALDIALKNDANVIIYGAPSQLFRKSKDFKINFHGLVFEEVQKNEGKPLVLRGDQLLTLGFDAGLILDAESPFDSYITRSETSQAISIDSTYSAGGDIQTRLYAKSLQSGRFVWMDFAPDQLDNGPGINVTHLNALMASIFRYLSHTTYSAIAMWPEAKPFAALIEQDTEDKFHNTEEIVKLVEQKGFPISWYILSNEAVTQRELTRRMSKVGEIACHGDNHSVFSISKARDQVIRIARCQKVLTELTGVKPLAFRPPEEKYTSSTIDAIVNNGMTHYIANNSPDRAVPEIQQSLVNQKTLVSIPRVVSDDYEMWHTRKLNKTESVSLIDDEINWINNIGGIYMYSFHSQFMGKSDNVSAIEHMGGRLKNSDAYFTTSNNIADWWRFRTAMQQHESTTVEQFSRFKPILLSVTKEGQIINEPIYDNE